MRSAPRLARLLSHVLLSAVLLSCTLTGCMFSGGGRTPGGTRLASAKVEVPLVRHGGSYWGEIRFDGRGPYALEFDSGSGVLVLSDAVTAELDLSTWSLPGRLQGAAASTWTLLRRGTVARVSLAGVEHTRVPRSSRRNQAAGDFDDVGFLTLELPDGKHGIFGIGLFAHCLATFDGPGQRILLEHGELPEADGVSIFDYRLVQDVPNLDVEVAGRRLAVTLDTGFSDWLRVSPEVARTLPLHAGEGVQVEVTTVHGDSTEMLRRLAGSIRIGVYEIRDPWVLVGEGDPLLGVRVLEHFEVTFDQANQRVRFERDAFAPIPVAGTRAGQLQDERAAGGASKILPDREVGAAPVARRRRVVADTVIVGER